MTSLLLPKLRRRAFTLVEMLVVIGLIVLVMGLAIPMISRAYRASMAATMAADLAVISNGLEAYKADFGDYPRRNLVTVNGKPFLGGALLCWALVAPGPAVNGQGGEPGDGNDGPGFRTRGVTGTVKGPYLPADRFTMGEMLNGIVTPRAGSTSNPIANNLTVLSDRYQRPILYFVANRSADPYSATVAGGAYLGGAQATFNYSDNYEGPTGFYSLDVLPNKLKPEVMCFRLGANGGGAKPDGTLSKGDSPATTGPYLLWSAGPDSIFGSADDIANSGSALQLNTSRVPSNYDPNQSVQ